MKLSTKASLICLMGILAGAASLHAQKTDSPKVSTLLSEAKSSAGRAADDAQVLQQFTTSGVSWQSHTLQIERMRQDINELGKTVQTLTAARSEASPWQQLAIDRINPLLQEMADTLTKTIKHMNDNPGRIHTQPYRDYTAANYDLASRMASVVHDFVEYGKVKTRAEQLEHKLEITSAASGS